MCKEDEVGLLDLWDCFVAKEDMACKIIDVYDIGGKGTGVFCSCIGTGS